MDKTAPVTLDAFVHDLNAAVSVGYLDECLAFHRRAEKRFSVYDDGEVIHYLTHVIKWDRAKAQYVVWFRGKAA